MEESHWPLVNRLIWKCVIPAAKLQCEGITVLKLKIFILQVYAQANLFIYFLNQRLKRLIDFQANCSVNVST